ncbi:MAG TPA: M48 family metalloprotease [Vicinamibacterales bacterium]|nr:M48 family metalloprotease [Vicinamibacterales bacterium]
MTRVSLIAALLLLSAVGHPVVARQQDPAVCRAPAPPVSRQPNIFTPAQEADLGDAVAERYEPYLRVIEDEALTLPLTRIGDRIVAHLPPTHLPLKFRLVDLPDANAFVLPGGRIYVSRKLLGFTRSEDELAGILGHELGHLVARQQSIDMTRRLREVIGVTEVGDRQDIFEKFNRLTDNAARKPGASRNGSREDGDQIEADRLGLYAVAASGYDPRAQVQLFDRLAGTEGKTGSFLARALGATSPDARRLGELLKAVAALPSACAEARSDADAQAYRDWQSAALSFRGLGRKESLHGVVDRIALNPALRGEITNLRFSPDGRYLLAQDDAGIAVLTREPAAVLFHVDAAFAEPAQFSPDSRDLLFHTADLRVERWRVQDQKLVDVRDLYWRTTCSDTALSPDGRTLACLDTGLDLWLIDATTGTAILHRKGFFSQRQTMNALAQMGFAYIPAGDHLVTMHFSPDSRYFLAGYRDMDHGTSLAYDLRTRAIVNLRNPGRTLATSQFAFVGADRVAGFNPDEPAKSGIFSLPSGNMVEQFPLSSGQLTTATDPNLLLVRPSGKNAVGVFDLTRRSFTKANLTDAFDLVSGSFATERETGHVGVFAAAGDTLIKDVAIPAGVLGAVRATAISSDFKWLAVSERSRGALWDLEARRRVAYVRGFNGAYFDERESFFADMPAMGGEGRAILQLSPASGQYSRGAEIRDRAAAQAGQWLIVQRMTPTGVALEMRDVRLPKTLWTRTYQRNLPEPWIHPGSECVVLTWDAGSVAGREIIRQDPVLRAGANLRDIDGDYVLEIVGAADGRTRRRMLVETGKGSFHIGEMTVVGDWLLVSDTIGRVLVYAVSSGDFKGYVVGGEPAISPSTSRLAVDTGGGRLVVYDLQTMEHRDDYTFTHPIVLASFNADGSRLFVLTSDQAGFVLQLQK